MGAEAVPHLSDNLGTCAISGTGSFAISTISATKAGTGSLAISAISATKTGTGSFAISATGAGTDSLIEIDATCKTSSDIDLLIGDSTFLVTGDGTLKTLAGS